MKYRIQFETDDPLIQEALASRDKAAKVVEALRSWTRLVDALRAIDIRLANVEAKTENLLESLKAGLVRAVDIPPINSQNDYSSEDELMAKAYRLIESGENFGKKKSVVPQGNGEGARR
ncbi:MAG: hypothetical protein NUW23_02310 [Firmicutes bacterium]|jgi:aminopeptidase C|nr:hypothetical protein [Bacillota bacterium]